MSKTATTIVEKQDNPLVLIRYSPENALAELATNATKMLARLEEVKITNLKTLEPGSELIKEAQITADELETFLAGLRGAVQNALFKFRVFKGLEDIAGNLTITSLRLRANLNGQISRLKSERAQYLAAEQEKTRREQLEKEAEQRRINQEAADKAAREAKKQGADKETVAAIKENVLATPAPIVTSKAAEVAKEAGASVRYGFTAEIYDLKKFLGLCLQNDVFLNTLKAAVPDIESAFRKMASDQRESFVYSGIRYKKTAIDVGRR